MRGKILASVLVGIIFLVTLSYLNAGILINQDKTTYNLGETLNIKIDIGVLDSGYLDVKLNCNGSSESIYYNVPETNFINIERKLTPDYINNLNGGCFISASYNNEVEQGSNFQISKEFKLIVDQTNLTYFAGDNINIEGSVTNQNNQLIGAIIELTIDNLIVNSNTENGKFKVNLTLPISMRAGNYFINIKAYDKDDKGNELNSANSKQGLIVKQKPARLDVALNKQTITPGEEVEVIPFIYDYAGDSYQGQVLMSIKDARSNIIFEGYKNANEKFLLILANNTAPGESKIIIQKDSLNADKSFIVNELKKITTIMENQTMILINSGNVNYKGIIQIRIGSENILKELSLKVAENKSFIISAPDGVYDVEIKDDNNIFGRESVVLTGRIISVREAGERISSIFLHYPIVWLFIALAIVLFFWVYLKKREEKKKFGFVSGTKEIKLRREYVEKKGGI